MILQQFARDNQLHVVDEYIDEGISGTGIAKRNEFQRMIKAAENGEIDIILTKSIQRFARNTVDLLETVRHLKDIGVEAAGLKEKLPLTEWAAIVIPQSGGGAWRR